ncbi:hypothetical protein SAMD00019534_037920 [Acytostelium subglobosum LB1]|uniref:hypothetical protein n=1 Tax=Acytostelium subglobosum LB1 TaxID=1410327 RepID=UPI0006447DED|nr:hypothetical protein SAMD00019534_037920 [Acytostelium subglobosum LB1]GAM20617.1 hypothetical protein SAMD00019534_037920 [Acytostelium subglobosum LB1]|eukprot:XP_012760138.1 hypothetical protein SAMD00019534_037920 [Acytostelium subglobosum LB1]
MPPKKKPAAQVQAATTAAPPSTTSTTSAAAATTSAASTSTTSTTSTTTNTTSSTSKTIRWYWAADSGRGTQDTLEEYDRTFSTAIEAAYQIYLKDNTQRKIKVDKDRYIDFKSMSQRRYDDKTKQRTVERKEELTNLSSGGDAPSKSLPKRELKGKKALTASKKRPLSDSSSSDDSDSSSSSSDSDSDDDSDNEDYFPMWSWAGDSGGGPANGGGHQDVWIKYDLDFSKKLEDSFKKGDEEYKVDSQRFIDLKNMLQRRYDDNNKRRNVKREDAKKVRPVKKKSVKQAKTSSTSTTSTTSTSSAASTAAPATNGASAALAIAQAIKCPSSWIDISMDYKEVDVYPNTKEFMWMSDLFASTLSSMHKGKSTLSPIIFNSLKVTRVVRVQNPVVWMRYEHRRQKILDDAGGNCPKVPLILTDIPNGPEVNSKANETFLFHGLNVSSIPGIVKFGFDPRFCSLEGMFGAGLYFAENSSKSNQYCHAGACTASGFQSNSCRCATSDEVCLLVCRVTLGDCLVENVFRGNAPGKFWYGRRTEPTKPDGKTIYNSVIGESKSNYGPKAELQLREYIVYESSQVYPEYKVYFKRVK